MLERRILASSGFDVDGSYGSDSFSSTRQTKSLADGLYSYPASRTDQLKMTTPLADTEDHRWSLPISGFTSRFDPKWIEQQQEQELMQAKQMLMQERQTYAASTISDMPSSSFCERPRPILRSLMRPITLMDILQERKEEMTKRPQRNPHDGRRKMMQVLGARDLYAEEMERRILEDQRLQALEEQTIQQIKQTRVGKLRKLCSRQAVIQKRTPSPSMPDLSNGTDSSDDSAEIGTRSSVKDVNKRESIGVNQENPSSNAIEEEVQDESEVCDPTPEIEPEPEAPEDDDRSGLRELERQQEQAMKQAFELAHADYVRKTTQPKASTQPPPAMSENSSTTQYPNNPANQLSADMQAFANSLDGILNRCPDQPPPRPKVEILPLKIVKAPPHRNGLPIEPSAESRTKSQRPLMRIGKDPPVLPHIGPIPEAPSTDTIPMQSAPTAFPSIMPFIPPTQAPFPYALQMQYLAMTNPMIYYQLMSQGANPFLPMMMSSALPAQYQHQPFPLTSSAPWTSSAPMVPQFTQHAAHHKTSRPQQTLIQQQQSFMDSKRPHRRRELNLTLEGGRINITPPTANLPAVEQWRKQVVPEKPPKGRMDSVRDDEDDIDRD